ncbi:MAG TPA: methylated-DNA--[protein]-cysteine S-methyltransferase [Candidatus Limnocylindrales bacterium]|nr:methylated-DNA--[protein]-cysteine S-methyltransferase [Candidatus Limnocylindrales bacterium]
MNTSLADARSTVRALRAVSPTPPPGFAERILEASGAVDRYARFDSPVGPVFVAWSEQGLSAVMQAGDPPGFERLFRAEHGRPVRRAEAPPRLRRAFERWLATGRPEGIAFDLRGRTEFEQAVLRKALEIPRGEVRPYGWVAREIGRERAVRAVGSALAGNPVPLLIPCHRVVRGDGHIGQYSLGGPAQKRALLAWEGTDPDALEDLAARGIRYLGSDTMRIFCLPTCRHARRISERHRRPFRSSAEAATAGYRPCRDCRPVAVAA